MIDRTTPGYRAADTVAKPRFRRLAEQLFRNGPRAFAEALAEIAARSNNTDVILDVMERHSAIPPHVARAVGADRLTPTPIEEVPKP